MGIHFTPVATTGCGLGIESSCNSEWRHYGHRNAHVFTWSLPIVLPLQVADMVAWHMRRRIDFPDEDHRKWPTAVFESLDRAECQISREYLASMAEHMAQVPGIELVHDKPKGYKPPSLIKE
jgi:hypothetical protein